MAKLASAAKTKAEPNEFYDTLSQTAQDTWDAIASYGWRPEKTDAGFEATKGVESAGPFESLSTLLAEVQKIEGATAGVSEGATGTENSTSDEGEDQATLDDGETVEVTELDEDHKGNAYLPGVKPIVDQQLANAAGEFFAANTEWKDAGKKRSETKATLETVAQMKKSLFHPDPDNSNSLIYHAGGLLIRIAKESATKVTVEVDKSDEGD